MRFFEENLKVQNMNMKYNKNFDKLIDNYLFSAVRAKKREYEEKHPHAKIVNLGVGDVVGGLAPSVVSAMQKTISEYLSPTTFKGYPPEQGYEFLRESIRSYYHRFGVELSTSEIYVSDGAKSDIGNILDIFDKTTSLIPNPVYPAYLDTNIMRGNKIKFVDGSKENGFLPLPDFQDKNSYLIYICSPNNPTGAVYTKEQLKLWVDYAIQNGSIIIFDSAYESFIREDYPRSIFEIEGSKTCAIEISSFSKRAGFTGLRLGFSIIPNDLKVENKEIGKLWFRRQSTRFNGVSYIIQKGGDASLSKKGIEECAKQVDYYLENAKILKQLFSNLGFDVVGGVNAPYLWIDCKKDSWEFFDYLLEKHQIVGTAGVGFGSAGKNYFRLSAFALREDVEIATERLTNGGF